MKLLVKNRANTYQQGAVIGVFEDDHPFGKSEDLSVYLAHGGDITKWQYPFVVVSIPDANKKDYEFLMSYREEDFTQRYFIAPPVEGSAMYNELATTGTITTSREVLDSMIIDKGE